MLAAVLLLALSRVASGTDIDHPVDLGSLLNPVSFDLDGRGVSLRPAHGSWRVDLALVRFGFDDEQREIDLPACRHQSDDGVEYTWNDDLTEWYRSGRQGLEHGFTLKQRPAGEGTLSFTLAVHGSLAARARSNGYGVDFTTSEGTVSLSYAGLHVFDALGRSLSSGLEVVPEGLRILVDERGATYPLTVDPIFQQAYIKASNTDAQDHFGTWVAIEGDTMAVCAPWESSAATGVDGDGSNDTKPMSGAVYVFVRSGGTWVQQAYLKASNTDAEDQFGTTVAISHDTIVVGAFGEDGSAIGVNGNDQDNSAPNSGAAYVFVREGTTWTQQAYLKASNTDAGDMFGGFLAISGDTIYASATWEASSATGVGGMTNDNSLEGAGAVYVFERNGSTWTQQAYLKASNPGYHDAFGAGLTLSGNTLVVGASGEDSGAAGVNGDQSDNSVFDSGAAYVFVRNGSTWTQQAYLKASNPGSGDRFGIVMALDGDTLAASAIYEKSSATGVNGNQYDDSMADAGAVYVFVRQGTTWTQQAYVKASNPGRWDRFYFVDLEGDLLVVGASGEDSAATGVNGNSADESASSAGAVYVYLRDGVTWSQVAYLKASNTGAGDSFGQVALSQDTLAVGAPGEASDATGVNGDASSNAAAASGAVYVFDVGTLAPGRIFCSGDGSGSACPCGNSADSGTRTGCLNSLGNGARLRATGSRHLGYDTLVLHGSQMTDGPCVYLQNTTALAGTGGWGVAFGDGLRCLGSGTVFLGRVRNVAGASRWPAIGDVPISIQGGVLAPGTRNYQVWYRDSASFCSAETFNLSNAVSIDWIP